MQSHKALGPTVKDCLLAKARRNQSGRLLLLVAGLVLNFGSSFELLSNWSDTDANGFNDTWTDPVSNVATTLSSMNLVGLDADSDGATNTEEATEGSNPYAIDSDLDGITDGDELTIGRLAIPGLSLTNWDSDGDFISDYDEFHSFYSVVYTGGILPALTGATYSDYDGDGMTNPNDPMPEDPYNLSPYNGSQWLSDALADYDGDGVMNFFDEWPNGDGGGAIIDMDGDGFDDWTDPYPTDSSNNGWFADVLGDADSDGIANWEDSTPYGPVDPPDPDNDADGLLKSEEEQFGTNDDDWDTDQDGLSDYEEVYIYYTNPMNRFYLSQLQGWGALYVDYVLVNMDDMDNDNIPNGVEWHYGLNADDPADALGDLDGDGINNESQYLSGRALNANLVSYDADGDGMTNLFETLYGLNPNNPNDAILDADDDGVTNFEEFKIRTVPNDPDSFDLASFLGHGDIAMLIAFLVYPNGNVPVSVDEDANGEVD